MLYFTLFMCCCFRRGVDEPDGGLVLGRDGGVLDDGALTLPSLCLGQNKTPQIHRRLQGEGLCSTGKQDRKKLPQNRRPGRQTFTILVPIIGTQTDHQL